MVVHAVVVAAAGDIGPGHHPKSSPRGRRAAGLHLGQLPGRLHHAAEPFRKPAAKRHDLVAGPVEQVVLGMPAALIGVVVAWLGGLTFEHDLRKPRVDRLRAWNLEPADKRGERKGDVAVGRQAGSRHENHRALRGGNDARHRAI